MEVKLENKEICALCGGKCCKKCGCDYATKDFENMSIDYLQSKLEEGNISIVSLLFFEKLKSGQITCIPLLYLRARNKNRPIVDLLSMKTTCSMLKEDGCPYDFENRPSGAKNSVPSQDFMCYPFEDPDKLILEPWKQYQKTLSRLVKRMTGYSVDAKLSMDVENLFKDIMNSNFEDVSTVELEEMINLVPLLATVYKDEYKRALNIKNSDLLALPILLKKLRNNL